MRAVLRDAKIAAATAHGGKQPRSYAATPKASLLAALIAMIGPAPAPVGPSARAAVAPEDPHTKARRKMQQASRRRNR